jgi:hypothetical protein
MSRKLTPRRGRDHLFTLTAPKPGEILILRSDEDYSMDQMTAIDATLRSKHPDWDGVLLVMKPGQLFEKMPRTMAKALYVALHKVFGHEGGGDGQGLVVDAHQRGDTGSDGAGAAEPMRASDPTNP